MGPVQTAFLKQIVVETYQLRALTFLTPFNKWGQYGPSSFFFITNSINLACTPYRDSCKLTKPPLTQYNLYNTLYKSSLYTIL